MNINAVASSPVKLPVSVPVPNKVEQEVKATAVKPERILTGAEKFAKEFYTKEEEPWNGQTSYGFDTESGKYQKIPMTRQEWIINQYAQAEDDLENVNETFEKFMKELHFLDPDLAVKNWSYTLDGEAQIKVLDPKGNLNDAEVERLTKAMNSFKDFTASVQSHAKTIMSIVDHDTEKFGGKYELSLLNFQQVIDYGTMSYRKKDPNEDWVRQVAENAEKRESSLIDLIA
ncbi:hypothetical protein [Pseudomonas caspiana]|uniref:hypothetical protein n=1 Tax=Pseudomonas caspiana TaxID=1451454 RepID=UPI0032EFA92C